MKKFQVFLVAVGLVFALSVPILAEDKTLEDRVNALEQNSIENSSTLKALKQNIGDWSFYGIAIIQTFYNDTQLDANTKNKDLRWDQACNARFGGNWKKDKLSANVELGLDDDFPGQRGGTGVRTRTVYGAYDFGDGTIVIGQDWTPLNSIVYSNQVVLDDLDLIGYGTIWEVWKPQLKLKIKGLDIALLEENGEETITGADSYNVNVRMPKVEFRYNIDREKFFADVFGGFFSYKVKDVTTSSVNYGDKTVNSWAAGVGGGLKLDPAYIRAMGYLAQNAINLGLFHTDASGAKFDATTGDLVNEDNLGVLLVAGTKIDKYTVEAGVGYVSSEYDESGSEKNNAISYYLNATIPIYESFFIVPEVGVLDHLDGSDGKEEHKDTTYFGVKWQLNF
jgi:hypothetical protein